MFGAEWMVLNQMQNRSSSYHRDDDNRRQSRAWIPPDLKRRFYHGAICTVQSEWNGMCMLKPQDPTKDIGNGPGEVVGCLLAQSLPFI